MAATNTLNMAPRSLATYVLHGDLQRFGRRIPLNVRSAADGVRALCMQLPELRNRMMSGYFQVRIAGENVTVDGAAQQMNGALPEGAIVHIVPRAVGADKGGIIQIIAGAALIAISIWNPLGLLTVAMAGGILSAGVGLAVGGVVQLLTPQPTVPLMNGANNGKQNTYFSSLDNMIAQGNALSVVYGEMRIGSKRISQELSTRDIGGSEKNIQIRG
ncbi:tail assembly protein [Edwardsiella tarda]|uniref:tail assembly protein n=1 Tax=Edwardsiella tarda TaxID=636 RepID=UPI002443A867|nr:tail assembly protein [Edwardsiella tarda]WGE30534.1 tail assembly protein [Edwardsiella tarda]